MQEKFILIDKNYHKVRDHCHFTGKYQGAAHSLYSLRYKENSFIPVLAHNASNFVNHLLFNKNSQKMKMCDIFKLRWCHSQDLLGSQIPLTKGGFELRVSCIRSSYLTHERDSQFKPSCGHWNL